MEAQLHRDEAHIVNDSPVVRSGLVQPTVMGTPVLAEDLYATHSDIVDPPMRSFGEWEEEDRRGDPPPISTGMYGTHPEDLSQFGHHAYGEDVNRDQLRGIIGKSTGVDKDPSGFTISPTSQQSKVSDQMNTVRSDEEKKHGDALLQSTGNYGTHPTDPVDLILDPPDEEKKHGDPLLQSTGNYETHPTPAGLDAYGQDVNKDQSRGIIGKSTGMEEANYQSKVTDSTHTGGKEAGITDILKSFHKMSVPDTKSSESDQDKPEVYTGTHDQFAPEPVDQNPPLDTIAANPSNPNQKITSATSAIADKATSAKDKIVSKLNPVYEKVVGAAMSKMQGTGHVDKSGSPKGVKEYLVDAFKPGDDDKVLSEVITNVLHRGKGDETSVVQETTTAYVIRDGRLQDSGN